MALPDTSDAHSGECSKVVGKCKNGKKTNKGARFDDGINRDNYVYQTKSEEYKMIAVAGISPQLSAMLAPEDQTKSAKLIEKKASEKEQFTNAPTVCLFYLYSIGKIIVSEVCSYIVISMKIRCVSCFLSIMYNKYLLYRLF